MNYDNDDQIRSAAFAWLEKKKAIHTDVMPRTLLDRGFDFQGNNITLLGPKGIWKPQKMTLPISISTTINGPYKDALTENNLLKYSYRGTDPNHPDNRGLIELMRLNKPLIYFLAVVPGKYLVTFPVYIVEANSSSLTFTVAVDRLPTIMEIPVVNEPVLTTEYRREYLTSTVLIRLHQRAFRERVLAAYQNQCTLCQLRHTELLDAAHIIGDKEELGEPIIQNGISLCKIHHAAFDANILGISPDYQISVRKDILEEIDGPMLKYGIQSLDKQKILLPSKRINWPDPDRLEQRYKSFLEAG